MKPFGARIRGQADERPDHPAIVFDERTITYAGLDDDVTATTSWLQSIGVDEGDRVAWLGPNRPAFIVLLLATLRLRAIFVPLNYRLTRPEHDYQVADSEPALILVDPSFAEHFSNDDGQSDARVRVVGPAADAPWRTSPAEPLSQPPVDIDPSTPALIVYTSGTTGQPKGAVHTHGSLRATIDNGISVQDFTETDITLSVLPMFHVGGLNIQTLPALTAGGTVLLHAAFDPGQVLSTIERERVTTTLLVPATIRPVIAHERFATTDFSSLRGVMTGSSIVPTDILETFFNHGIRTGQIYGSTETGPTAIALQFADAERFGCAGRAAGLTEVQLADTGEILVRGPLLFSGYWNNPEATSAAFTEDWFHTGDIASMDEDGWVTVLDRLHDVIISGGENIYPAEVERVLSEAPGVDSIVVLPRDDDRWGQVPVAYVVPGPDGPPTLDELQQFARERLARFKVPVAMTLVDDLPRTALGKVQRFRMG